MVFTNIRFQIAAIALLFIIMADLLKKKRLPLYSTRCFIVLLAMCGINLCFDIATVYTVWNVATVPTLVNRICHQFFIGSLDTIIFSLFIYVYVLGGRSGRLRWWAMILLSLPYAGSMIMVLFADLYYYNDGLIAYSYGPMANTVYASVGLYFILTNILAYRYLDDMKVKTRYAIHSGTLLWLIIAGIQLFNPGILLSGLGCVLMILDIYLSFENLNDLKEPEIECFNRFALYRLLSERMMTGSRFYLVCPVIESISKITTKLGYEAANKMLDMSITEIKHLFGDEVFRYSENTLAVFARGTQEEVRERAELLEEQFQLGWQITNSNVRPKYYIAIIECPKSAKTTEQVFRLIEFISEMRAETDRETIRFADDELLHSRERHEAIEKMIESAMMRNGFEVYYQPIYSAEKEACVSCEALIRLKDTETLGYISPEEFIPIAERKGYIFQIGKSVFRNVCRFASTNEIWQAGLRQIEVNLSGLQISDRNLPREFEAIMDEYEIPRDFINFEITETSAVESGNILDENMERLRMAGTTFSMDDFGTGFSNLAQVIEMAFELIKIDKGLVWGCFSGQPEKSLAVMNSIISMAKGMGIKIVAEGVETKQQVDTLLAMGVDYLQGFYFSKPLPEAEYFKFIKENLKNSEENMREVLHLHM